jgi:GT2 family glycosyltransferase
VAAGELIALYRHNRQLLEALRRQQHVAEEYFLRLQLICNSVTYRFIQRFQGLLGPVGSRRRRLVEPVRKALLGWRTKSLKALLVSFVHKARVLLAGGDREIVEPRLSPAEAAEEARSRYLIWMHRREPNRADLDRQRKVRQVLEPTLSLVVPIRDTPVRPLLGLIESVREQTYPHWQLCLADGGRRNAAVRAVLAQYRRLEPRICFRQLPRRSGLAETANAALELASGAYVTFLDADGALAPFALFEVVRALNQHPDADLLYSDEDRLAGDSGQRQCPFFKPAWSPDLLRSCNYLGRLTVFRRALLSEVGGFRPDLEGAHEYDLALRAGERCRTVVHVPRVLYHGYDPGPDPFPGLPACAVEPARRALREHLQRCKLVGEVRAHAAAPGHVFQVQYHLSHRRLVSILIPNKDSPGTLHACLESIRRSSYAPYEIVIAENNSRSADTVAYYQQLATRPDVRVLTWPGEFNFAAINNWAARQARGEVLLFLNNDIEVLTCDWLERLLEHALRDEVGGVGAMLLYPDGTVQHAGMILGVRHSVGHAHRHVRGDAPGAGGRLLVTQNFSCVTGACLMMRRDVFEAAGGFDERFKVTFNDVDLCQRVRQAGKVIVWTPYARLLHHECKTRGSDRTAGNLRRYFKELRLFEEKWPALLSSVDPYYNPNLSSTSDTFLPDPDAPEPQPRATRLSPPEAPAAGRVA